MKKWDGLVEKVLSGAFMVSMMLGLFVPKAFSYSDVYGVKPTSTGNSGSANAVWETFVATCDSIDSVTYFVGAEATDTTANYLVSITDSATSQEVWSSSRSARGWKYQDMGFGVRKPVVRGKKYYLRMSISAQYQQTWNYFYDNTNPYSWGVMGTAVFGPQGGNDLAARVIGRNRIPQTYFGVNAYIGNSCDWLNPARRDLVMAKLDSAGIKLNREQIPWYKVQGDNGNTNTYSWDSTDHAVAASARRDMPILFNHFGFTPKWASSWNSDSYPNDSVRWRSAPPRNLDADTAGGTNYFYNYMKKLARRYGPNGVFWDSTALGESLKSESHYHPVRDWEINNEVNLLFYWDFWWQGQYYTGYSYDTPGRAKLYWKACQLAWAAIKGVDSGARIYTNGVFGIQSAAPISGKEWLRTFYDQAQGQIYTDVLTYHFYNNNCVHWFYPSVFEADYDTVRELMRQKGDTLRPVWADEGGWGTSTNDTSSVSLEKQADMAVQVYNAGISQLTNPRGPLNNVSWFSGFDWYAQPAPNGQSCGIMAYPLDSVAYKKSGWAYKQMTGKLKNLYFNRRIPFPDAMVQCYEFEDPGTRRKTLVVWRDSLTQNDSIPIRTAELDTIMIAYNASPDSGRKSATGTGRAFLRDLNQVPRYIKEVGDTTRPDVVVDSLYTVPTSLRAGDYVFFYARLKNIGNATLSANLGNAVKFQVDGVSQKTYSDSRAIMKDSTIIVGYNPYPPPGDGSIYDWKATWGDHLIRAWVDSADHYVELREDNNTGYLYKHIRPKVSLIINNGAKYSNHLTNNVVSVVINGGTTPNPDSTYFRHESGYWNKIAHTTSFDTLVTYSGNGVFSDSVLIFQGADTALAGDSIIVDASAPYTAITSPPDSQTVNLNAQVEFWGFSYDFEYHDSLWEIWENSFAWADSNNRVGYYGMIWVPGYFGTWTAWSTGWHTHTLVSRDSATNIDTSVVHVYVNNSGGGDGDGFGAGFGSFSSAPMNVTTDPNGNLFVAETQNSKVRKYSPKKDSLFAFSARRSDSTGLNWAVGMALKDSTILYVADGYGHAIKAFDKQGNLLLRFGNFGTDTSQFKQPCGIALDWKDRLWVTDRLNHRIQVFDTTGHFLFQFGSQGQDSGKFNSPTGIAINKYKQVFVSDTKNNQVQVFDSLGNWKKTIKEPDTLGFDTPTGICSDKHGNLFIADTKHNRIVELNPFGKRLFIFGEQGDSLWQFRNPIGVASSPGGHYLYVADMGNKRVTRFWVIRGDTLGGGGPQAGAVVQLLPLVYELGPAIPNPSKGQTTFRYALPKESRVNMTFYNVAGQVVKEINQGKQKAGYYSLTWDGRSNLNHRVGAGVYFYRLQAGSWVKTRKMIVIR